MRVTGGEGDEMRSVEILIKTGLNAYESNTNIDSPRKSLAYIYTVKYTCIYIK